MTTTEEFLNSVLGTERDGHIEIKTDDFQLSRWFNWPGNRALISKYLGLRQDEDAWFSAMLFRITDRHAENATTTRAVYMDADECDPTNFRLQPTWVVQTSEGRWQCYWVLDKDYQAKDVWNVAHRIAVAHKRQGCDPSGWVPSKMMRVPGTTNLKRSIPFRVEITEHNADAVYTLEEVEETYSDIDLRSVAVQSGTVPEVLPRVIDVVKKIPNEVYDLYDEDVPEGGSWSERMWALLMALFEDGFEPGEAFVVAKAAKCNKYDPRNAGKLTQSGVKIPARKDPDGVLWAEVQKALASYQDGITVAPADDEEAEEGITHSAVTTGAVTKPEFLTPEERELVEDNPSFIDDYTNWVATKTDSAPRYQRSLAWLLLSNVYGHATYINTVFGKMDLNLWLLIMGDSTFTRKSTARSLFLRVLHEFERRSTDQIDIGSDFTSEGLNKTLAERDGQVSLIHRDEIHGFFHEIFNKAYMAGAVERMTELYDGKVQVSLRANKDSAQTKRAHTTFSILGLGIREELADVLTAKHFRSGFLARFLWSVADTPDQITRDMVVIGERKDEHDSISQDATIDMMVDGFQDNILDIPKGERRKISFDPVAKERFDDWCVQVAGVSDQKYRTEHTSVVPAVERMKISVWKCAALLAFHMGGETIEMFHLMHALAQAELWYEDMMRMASLISASDFERKVGKVEQYIAEAPSGVRRRASIYRKFASFRTHEVDEWIDALVKGGVVEGNKELSLVGSSANA